jgi:hypothetical protein
MQIIHHRINTLKQLDQLCISDGAEIDIRYHLEELSLHHDPFHNSPKDLPSFESFLCKWKNTGPLILNLKSEGLEDKCIELMNKHQIVNWFFLDMSMPFFVKYSIKSQSSVAQYFSPENLAVRFSDFEPIEYALSFEKSVQWVWVDTFNNFPLTPDTYKQLKESQFKLCLVSPELQGLPIENIIIIKRLVKDFEIDAVCTKHPELWKE